MRLLALRATQATFCKWAGIKLRTFQHWLKTDDVPKFVGHLLSGVTFEHHLASERLSSNVLNSRRADDSAVIGREYGSEKRIPNARQHGSLERLLASLARDKVKQSSWKDPKYK